MTSAGADPPERGSAEGIKLDFGRKNIDARSIPVTTRTIDATREPAGVGVGPTPSCARTDSAVGPPRAGKPLGRALSFGSAPRSTPAQRHALLTQLAEVSRLPHSDQLTRMAHAQSSLEQYLHKMSEPKAPSPRPATPPPLPSPPPTQPPEAPPTQPPRRTRRAPSRTALAAAKLLQKEAAALPGRENESGAGALFKRQSFDTAQSLAAPPSASAPSVQQPTPRPRTPPPPPQRAAAAPPQPAPSPSAKATPVAPAADARGPEGVQRTGRVDPPSGPVDRTGAVGGACRAHNGSRSRGMDDSSADHRAAGGGGTMRGLRRALSFGASSDRRSGAAGGIARGDATAGGGGPKGSVLSAIGRALSSDRKGKSRTSRADAPAPSMLFSRNRRGRGQASPPQDQQKPAAPALWSEGDEMCDVELDQYLQELERTRYSAYSASRSTCE